MPPRTLAVLSVVACVAVFPAHSLAAEATIGIYSDATGFSCSFNGDTPGIFTAYVVIKPGATPLRGAQFAAPTPSCFNAVFLGESATGPITAIGSSQTGISVSSQYCESSPFAALQITYLNNGGTSACCPFPIVEDPSVGTLEATDCAFEAVPITAKVAQLNANESCQCSPVFPPPNPPSNPSPANGATAQHVGSPLQFVCSDPGGLAMRYDLYLGTDPSPPLVAGNIPTDGPTIYHPASLSFNTTYYWRVVVRNLALAETSGPVWSFTTGSNTPAMVTNTSPANGATGVIVTPWLTWISFDPDFTPLTYDVYFGTSATPPMVASDLSEQDYRPGPLSFATTYYWRIVAQEVGGTNVSTPTWSFTTKLTNSPPGPITNAPPPWSPPDGSTNINLTTDLEWECTDPDGQALKYDVYFGTSSNPPKIVTDRGTSFYTVSQLHENTLYYWRIVARDPGGLETSGPTWRFTTKGNRPPAVPSSPSPPNNTTNSNINVTLQWQCSDPDNQLLVYDVYFGTGNPPPLVSTNENGFQGYPLLPGVQYGTTYFWRILARDPLGAETSSPVWTFTTRANSPPNVPVPTYPVPGQSSFPIAGELKWGCSDPDLYQTLAFDVYFGTAADPPLVVAGQPYTAYTPPSPMQPHTTHRWRIVARDPLGAERSSPVWTFTTAGSTNQPPSLPFNPNPANLSSGAPRNPTLTWSVHDPDGNPLVYKITVWADTYEYWSQTLTVPQFPLSNLTRNEWYYWKVEVTDGMTDVHGPVWQFYVTGGTLPVLFSRFEAKIAGDGVDVAWELSSDEPMDRFTLYRRDGENPAHEIGEGKVDSDRGSYRDHTVEAGKSYQYELVVRASDGDEFRSQPAKVVIPALTLTLHQNVPNPFNPQTAIRYDLPSPARVRLTIVDIAGRRVRTLVDEDQTGGSREVIWIGRDDTGQAVSSGVYFYVLDVGKERLTKKLVLLK